MSGLAFANNPAPSTEELLQRAAELSLVDDQLSVEALLGRDSEALAALDQPQETNRMLSMESSRWAALNAVGFSAFTRGERAVVLVPLDSPMRPLGERRAEQVLSILDGACERQRTYAALIVTDRPDHPVCRLAPAEWPLIFVPADPDRRTETVSVGDLRLAAVPMRRRRGWAPIELDGQLVGLARHGEVRLRVHPFACSSNHGASWNTRQEDQRRRLLDAALAAGVAAGFAVEPEPPTYLREWRRALRNARWLQSKLARVTSELAHQITDLDQRLDSCRNEVEQLRQRLASAEAELREAEQRAAAKPMLAEAARRLQRDFATKLADELAAIRRLPQVAEADLRCETLVVRTRPLVLDCGAAGKRRLADGVRLAISAHGNEMPQVASDHPLRSARGFDWGDAELPLAERIGNGQFGAAVSIACGAMARRIDVAECSLPAAAEDERPGYRTGR